MHTHSHKLVIGAASLVRGKVRNDIVLLERARDAVEPLMGDTFFAGAPFERVSLMIRYGHVTNLEPEYQKIQQGYLNISVEIAMDVIIQAQPNPPTDDQVFGIFRDAIIQSVRRVAEKYGLEAEMVQ